MFDVGIKWRLQLPQLIVSVLLLPTVAPICYDQSPFWFVSQVKQKSIVSLKNP
jgi:hypothetical protein